MKTETQQITVINNNSEKSINDEKVYNYNEAIELAGNGCYNYSLLGTLSITLLMMCVDLFSFSFVVAMAGCDLQLTLSQKSLLISIPFMGPVIMAYAWGYICDTRGRRRSVLVAMSVSFIMSSLCAFAPGWKTLAVLKFIGTCFVSCAQSGSYTLMGESCPEQVKGTYFYIMNSTIHLNAGIYFVIGYFVSDLNFSYDLGYITFVPWRLLFLIFALPLGCCALALFFFYESPKFLLNAGREDEALYVLSQIYRRNGGKNSYKVQRVVLNEEGNLSCKDMPLLKSMWVQTAPLFKPPYLWNTMLLYYLIFVIYSTNSSLYVWLPFITKAFVTSSEPDAIQPESFSLCSYIKMTTNSSSDTVSCTSSVDPPIMIASVAYGIIVFFLNLLLSRLASFKKALMMSIFTLSALSILVTLLPFSETNYFYFATFVTSILMGSVSVYYVELYPTSFRGMAGCLGVMVARLSSVVGINVVGPLIMAHCTYTFYGIAAVLLSGTLMSLLLPSDKKPNKA